ncbi:MAG TPA: hypothetical protein VHN99_06035 [Deinococcales bacterium]|nr:hypothetical protein [Deinococcales bacterium]
MRHRYWVLAALAFTSLLASSSGAPAWPVLERHPGNPVIVPQGQGWEGWATFNPSVFRDPANRLVMLYRAQDKAGVSRFGRATSTDGLTWTRDPQPVFAPQGAQEAGGVEDPRVVKIGTQYVLTYTAYDGKGSAKLALATSPDGLAWTRRGLVFPELPWSKSGAILPTPLNGTYFMYWGDKDLYLATSKDGLTWTRETEAVLSPRAGMWDSGGVEPGPAPFLTPQGIWLYYNGRDTKNVYGVGAVLFSRGDPGQALRRTDAPLLKPETPYELKGTVPNVVFAEGLDVQDGVTRLYYGGGDQVVGIVTAK